VLRRPAFARGWALETPSPGMDGYDLTGQIRARFPGEPLRRIAVSGWSQEEHRVTHCGFLAAHP
jgi:hypothetical protein